GKSLILRHFSRRQTPTSGYNKVHGSAPFRVSYGRIIHTGSTYASGQGGRRARGLRRGFRRMTKSSFAILGVVLAGLCVAGNTIRAERAAPQQAAAKAKPAMIAAHAAEPTGAMTADAQNKMVGYYCTTCHDDEAKTGGLTLEHFDAARV